MGIDSPGFIAEILQGSKRRRLIRPTIGKKSSVRVLDFLDLEMKQSAESAENQTLGPYGRKLSNEYIIMIMRREYQSL